MTPALLVLLAYVVGATPTSHWVGKGIYGVDLRTLGSGNLGATNVYRNLGAKAALPVVVVDVAKGWLPVWVFPRLQGAEAASEWVLAYGAAAIAGHVFSFWVGFRGGKGVATSGGVLLGLAPIAVAMGFLVWLAAVWTTGIVSLGSILAAVAVPLTVAFVSGLQDPPLLAFTAALGAFVIWAHRSNIGRLLRGEEASFRKKREDAR